MTEIYDILGRRLARLASERMEVGIHRAHLDGSRLPSGAYVYRLKASEEFTDTGRMVSVK